MQRQRTILGTIDINISGSELALTSQAESFFKGSLFMYNFPDPQTADGFSLDITKHVNAYQ